MTKIFFIVSVIMMQASCSKMECVKKSAPEMVGDWSAHFENGGYCAIHIQENGRGYIYSYNNDGNIKDTQRRKWYIKNDILFFSKFYNSDKNEMFIIELYPTVASSSIISTYDTVNIGESYMILDGRYYTKYQ